MGECCYDYNVQLSGSHDECVLSHSYGSQLEQERSWKMLHVNGKCWVVLDTGSLAQITVGGEQLLKQWQGGTNIFTDIVYVVAPLIYLSTIQLPRRTQWGLRVVFCLGLG